MPVRQKDKPPVGGWKVGEPLPPSPIALLPSKYWPAEALRHILPGISGWKNVHERDRAILGMARFLSGGILVPTNDTWWIQLPALFALTGPFRMKDRSLGRLVETWYDAPSGSLKPTETARMGQMVINPYLDTTEQISWRNEVAHHPERLIKAHKLAEALIFKVDWVYRVCEGRLMVESAERIRSLTESQAQDAMREAIKELTEHPSHEAMVRGLRLLGHMRPEQYYIDEELAHALWVAVMSVPEELAA